jgi:hypothetical protein
MPGKRRTLRIDGPAKFNQAVQSSRFTGAKPRAAHLLHGYECTRTGKRRGLDFCTQGAKLDLRIIIFTSHTGKVPATVSPMKVRRKDEHGRQAARAKREFKVPGSRFEVRISAKSLPFADYCAFASFVPFCARFTGNMVRIRVNPTFQSFEELDE